MDKILEFARKVIKEKVNNPQTSVDCTCGRGHDTKFLCDISENVIALDIQKEAIDSTKDLLQNYTNVKVIQDSHVNIDKYIDKVDVVMYNLGYLPKGDKNITTHKNEVILSLKKAMNLLANHGIITICVYPGHPEGMKESNELITFLSQINQKEFDIVKYEFVNQINYPPYLLSEKLIS